MPTRELLAPSQRAQFTEIPTTMTDRDMARYYTLTPEDRQGFCCRRVGRYTSGPRI